MGKGRLEAFSDGVIAVIITIMVLELKAPHGQDLAALMPLGPALLSYCLSFVYVGIYWNNHHHMLRRVQHVVMVVPVDADVHEANAPRGGANAPVGALPPSAITAPRSCPSSAGRGRRSRTDTCRP